MDVRPSLIANLQGPISVQPRVSSLHDPPPSAPASPSFRHGVRSILGRNPPLPQREVASQPNHKPYVFSVDLE